MKGLLLLLINEHTEHTKTAVLIPPKPIVLFPGGSITNDKENLHQLRSNNIQSLSQMGGSIFCFMPNGNVKNDIDSNSTLCALPSFKCCQLEEDSN